jgi:hypothetical protein
VTKPEGRGARKLGEPQWWAVEGNEPAVAPR